MRINLIKFMFYKTNTKNKEYDMTFVNQDIVLKLLNDIILEMSKLKLRLNQMNNKEASILSEIKYLISQQPRWMTINKTFINNILNNKENSTLIKN